MLSNYLTSTVAPASSRAALASSAASLSTPSLIVDGNASHASFASLSPRPVRARTAVITPIFLAPESVSTTSN
jgi:hypothetical protein